MKENGLKRMINKIIYNLIQKVKLDLKGNLKEGCHHKEVSPYEWRMPSWEQMNKLLMRYTTTNIGYEIALRLRRAPSKAAFGGLLIAKYVRGNFKIITHISKNASHLWLGNKRGKNDIFKPQP